MGDSPALCRDKTVNQGLMTVRQYIEKILSCQKERDYLTAYNILQEAITYHPTNEFLQASEVYLLLRLKKLKEAKQKAEARIATLRSNPFFLRTYIEILSKERDIRQLLHIADWLKSLVRDEKLYIYLAENLIRFGERQAATELLNSGLSLPSNKEINHYLQKLRDGLDEASIGYYREKFSGITPERAISEIENILVLPDYERNISIRLFLAELYKKTGNLRRASEVYSDCLKIKDSTYIRKMLGFVYYRMGEMDKAFLYLKDPFLEDPQDHALYNTVAKIIEKTGNTKEAEALINEALSRHPDAGKIYGLLRRIKRGGE